MHQQSSLPRQSLFLPECDFITYPTAFWRWEPGSVLTWLAVAPLAGRNTGEAMLGITEYLMFDATSEINDSFESESERAHEFMIILSAIGGNIPETFFRLYSVGLDVHDKIMENALGYFMGVGLVKVDCDCEDADKSLCSVHSIQTNDYYGHGESSVGHSSEWYNTRNRVVALSADIWG